MYGRHSASDISYIIRKSWTRGAKSAPPTFLFRSFFIVILTIVPRDIYKRAAKTSCEAARAESADPAIANHAGVIRSERTHAQKAQMMLRTLFALPRAISFRAGSGLVQYMDKLFAFFFNFDTVERGVDARRAACVQEDDCFTLRDFAVFDHF